MKLRKYQEEQMAKLGRLLNELPTYSTWRNLLDVVYCRVVIFNKRRGGETAKLLLQAYVNRPTWERVASDAIVSTLTPVEQRLLRR